MSTMKWMLAAATALTMVPKAALACGGLFCSGANPVAVEQNAERILFSENDDGTFSAIVEIQYVGDSRKFSWVVPVPATPTLGQVPPSTLQVLDLLTRPTIINPPTGCSQPLGSSSSLGCEDSLSVPRSAEDGGVNVENLARVGPFEPQVISAEDPKLIFDWLNANGYLLTDPMRPIVEKYAKNGMKFLALKLAPDASTNDITPIKMTYATPCPMVPLALTAVSAEPEMSVLVLHLGKTRMRSANYQNLEINPDDVRVDGQFRNNYYALVSHRIDEAGGRAFVTELAGPTSGVADPSTLFTGFADQNDANDAARALLATHPYLTRMYARLSAWEMTVDPEFEASDRGDLTNVFDLSKRVAVETCGSSPGVTCGNTYCGDGSECGVSADGAEGCVCKAGTVARSVTIPALGAGSVPGVMCQDAAFQMILSGTLAGPCAGFSCGTGSCVVTNGFPTCACAEGELARLAGNGMVCEKAVEKFDAKRLVWSEIDANGGSSMGCMAGVGAGAGWAIFGLVALRRRRVQR